MKGLEVFLRTRAERLLERIEGGVSADVMVITPEDIEELHRIASSAKEEDREFLGRFDVIYMDDEERE